MWLHHSLVPVSGGPVPSALSAIGQRRHVPVRFGTVLPVLMLCGSILVSPAAFAKRAQYPVVPVSELHQGQHHEQVLGIINHLLNRYHYRDFDLDDALSEAIFDAYLESLDQGRFYFTAEDVERFASYRSRLDDAIADQDVHPAFAIFHVYRERVEDLSAYAAELLSRGFDYTVDERFLIDRSEVPWADNMTALRALWRKRVKNDALALRLADKSPDEITETLDKRYARLAHSTRQINSDDVFQIFVNAYTKSVEPHTSYFSPQRSENFDIGMRLSLEGIGAVLRIKNEYTEIVRVIPGGPAAISGLLHIADFIVGVAQDLDGPMIDVVGWRLDDVVDMIRGEKGTTLRLKVLSRKSGHEPPAKVITLVRDEIKLEEQAADASVIELPDRTIGVISIPIFYMDFIGRTRGEQDFKSTSRDVQRLIGELVSQGIDGLIVDLRGNGGGSLAEALALTGLFIEQGPVLQTRDASGQVKVNQDPIPGTRYLGPLAVLVDRDSASASEIFAAAIQDYQRGIIVGETTFGKGTVQNIIDLKHFLKDPELRYGRLKTTIAQFYRVNGGSNQYKGVVPDIVFPTGNDSSEYGERAERNALPWDTVDPVAFVPAGAPVANFAETRRRHERRIREDELFQLFLEALSLDRRNSERTHLSLLETMRTEEKERLHIARRDIQNRMRALVGLQPLPEKDNEDEDIPDVDSEAFKKEQRALDVLLKETAYILDDLILPVQQAGQPAEAEVEAGSVFMRLGNGTES